MDGAATALNRLRAVAYEWGEPGAQDEQYTRKFTEFINDDLNMPRALALTWELVKSDLPIAMKKATLLHFDKIFGLQLAEWKPVEIVIPEAITLLVEQRQQARRERRWNDADALREQIHASGHEVEDTPQGPKVRRRKS
jgi:cysteinyl-tRNA synthetase